MHKSAHSVFDDGVYDLPRNLSRASNDEDYDFPKSHFAKSNFTGPALSPKQSFNDDYDVLPTKQQHTKTPLLPRVIPSEIASSNSALSNGLSYGSRNSIASNSSSESSSMFPLKV